MYVEDNPLRRARLQRGVSISQVIARTMLSPRIVHMIDAGQFADLPGGIYARSYIRAVATAVGLDPEDAVAGLVERLPPAQDPLPTLREISRLSDPAWLIDLTDMASSLRARLGAAAGGLKERVVTATSGWPGTTRRAAAAAIDAVILLALLAVIARTTAWTCGVGTDTLLAGERGGLAVMWGILVTLYFVLLGGIGGRTPGAYVSQLPHGEPRSSLHLPAVLERALMY